MKKIIALTLLLCMAVACIASMSAAAVTTTDPKRVYFNAKAKSYLSGANNTTATVEADDTESGYSVKLVSKSPYTDPFVAFNFGSYVQYSLKLTAPTAEEVKYVILKVKEDRCSNNMFELFYFCGSSYGAVAGQSVVTSFEQGDGEWQYLVFPVGGRPGWSGKINGFRFDWELNASRENEVMYINEILLAADDEEMKSIVAVNAGTGEDLHALTDAQQAAADKLIAQATDNAPEVSNEPLTAEHEDKDLVMWFDHAYYKTPGETVTSNGKNTYQMRLAKNETEAAQMVLASSKAYGDLTIEVSDFVNGTAHIAPVVYYGFYFDDVEGQSIVDPIPVLDAPISLTAGKSQMFLIKIKTTADSPAGQYKATVTVKDGSGSEIKRANVYAYVWDFALPEKSSVKALADVGWWGIYAADPQLYSGDDGQAYRHYYDTLLENKMNAYNMPYVGEAEFESVSGWQREYIEAYLNDPRVQAFNPIGFSKALTTTNAQRAYNYLSQHEEWLDKAYFYTVDEPMNQTQLDRVRADANTLKGVFGSKYKLITPMHLNGIYDSDYKVDAFEYVRGYVNVWCPHTFFFNTYADKKADPTLTYRSAKKVEENLGTFPERMASEQEKGNEVWWYVTRFPHKPEIALSIDDAEVDHRILFWQQKLYNVDGFLYYSATDWYGAGSSQHNWGWDKKLETSSDAMTPYTFYGNGVLLYHGGYVGKLHECVESIRLESIRDGIEDYDYFVLLDEKFGEGTSELMIKQVTTSLGNYDSDIELFTRIRTVVGNLIEQGPKGLAGDVNRDGEVGNKDVAVLFSYVNGNVPEVIDTVACDTNGDGEINNKDVVLLFRYVSGAVDEICYGTAGADAETFEYNGVTVTLPKDYSGEEINGAPTFKHKDSTTDMFNFATDQSKSIHTLNSAAFLELYKSQGFTPECTGWVTYTVDGKNVTRGDFTLSIGDISSYATVVIVEVDAGDIMITFARLSDTYKADFESVISSIRVK